MNEGLFNSNDVARACRQYDGWSVRYLPSGELFGWVFVRTKKEALAYIEAWRAGGSFPRKDYQAVRVSLVGLAEDYRR